MPALTELLQEMESLAAAEHVPILTVRARDAFIRVVKEQQPRRILEVGTAIGYSALLMLANASREAVIDTIELSESRAAAAGAFFARSVCRERIHLYQGDAGKLLADWQRPGSGYDFVFLDAAKGQYVDYWHKIRPLLSEPAVVLADNVLFRGYVLGEVPVPRRFRTIAKRLRQYLKLAGETPGCRTEVLKCGDGLAVTYFQRNQGKARV